MTSLIIFVWWILVRVPPSVECTLWLERVPTSADVDAACRGYDLTKMTITVRNYHDRRIVCSMLPATDIYQINVMCPYTRNPSEYVIEIIQPAYTTLSPCTIKINHEGYPTEAEITDQCGWDMLRTLKEGRGSFVFGGKKTQEPEAPRCAAASLPVGAGLYDQAPSMVSLYSEDDLTWLAGALIWYGIVKPDCDGYSGLDPYTLLANPCGMKSARWKVIAWQNQWDTEIYSASVIFNVPARLLKRMMGIESQFWPLYVGKAGEMGVMQVTENGADVLLRFDPILDPDYSSRKEETNFWTRLSVRNQFACRFCNLGAALNHTRQLIPLYARLLAAYRCRAVSMNPSLSGLDAWRQAVIDYNGTEDYLRKVEQ